MGDRPLYPTKISVRLDVNGLDVLFSVSCPSVAEAVRVGEYLSTLPHAPGASHQGGGGNGDGVYCNKHQVQMTRHEKDGQVWFSHKAPDGSWCRGA